MDIPKKITFRFEKDDDYRIISVNGVWGGPTPRGDIMVDLFHEAQSLPEEVTHETTTDGQLGNEIERTPPGTLQRTVMVGLTLTVDQAESIGLWLQNTARQIREQAIAKGAGGDEQDSTTTH